MCDDFELLREHIEQNSEEAFRTLVERHSGMVHGTALRIVRDEHSAEEVTQAVFIRLMRKAKSLRRGTILAGWLYRTARFVALEALRVEQRRQQYDQQYAQMNNSLESASVWDQIAPLLEPAMDCLRASERDAVVLRFLEERSFAEVAGALGTTEAAAKMRVGRALERLRAVFARRGVAVPTAALLATLTAHSSSAAPAGLSASIAAVALEQHTATNSSLSLLMQGARKAMLWNKIKTGLIGICVALLLAGSAFVLDRQVLSRPRPIFLASLAPMAGEWEGTFDLRGSELINPVKQAVALSVSTANGGRACEIEMRVSDTAGRPSARYHFTHTLNDSGDRILTIDDPQIARMAGDGTITESIDNRRAGVWRAAFRTPHTDGTGFSECRWVRKGDQLSIARRDRTASARGWSDLFSDLNLHRRSGTQSIP